jgi:hypothetical protein
MDKAFRIRDINGVEKNFDSADCCCRIAVDSVAALPL